MENLDPDILRSIIRVLKPSALELCALSTLSLKWKEACYSDEFWLEVDVDCSRKQNIYNWGLEMLSERLKSAEYLSFRSLHFPDRPNPWIHFGLEKILMLCGPVSLKKLSLDYICQLPFTDLLLNKIGSHCPLLEDFSLTATNYFSSDSAVATFIRACPNIKHLKYFVKESHPLHGLGDVILWQISKKLPNLETLELNGQNMSENGLFALENCVNLKRLGLHGYKRGVFDRAKTQEDDTQTNFPSLEEISFSFVLPSAGEVRRLIRMCPNLRRIELFPEDGDERSNSHAQSLGHVIMSEFPLIEYVIEPASHVCAENLTAAQLERKYVRREGQRSTNCSEPSPSETPEFSFL